MNIPSTATTTTITKQVQHNDSNSKKTTKENGEQQQIDNNRDHGNNTKRQREENSVIVTTTTSPNNGSNNNNQPQLTWIQRLEQRVDQEQIKYPQFPTLVKSYLENGYVIWKQALIPSTISLLLCGEDSSIATTTTTTTTNNVNVDPSTPPDTIPSTTQLPISSSSRLLRTRSANQVWSGAIKTIHANISMLGEMIQVKGPVAMRGQGRFDLNLPVGPISLVQKDLQQTGVLDFLKLLCPRASIRTHNVMLSQPDSLRQCIHTDSDWNKVGMNQGKDGPSPHYVTVLIPLTKQTSETGSTRIWPGTHKIREMSPEQEKTQWTDTYDMLEIGDALIFDGLLAHCGLENRSRDQERYFYYCAFSRFHDDNVEVTGV
jgi:hypothetical protein